MVNTDTMHNINEQPLVSIIIPVYNGGNYMREAIDSALAQTYENIEIIVVNDGSNDGGETERIALSYGAKIRYFSKENGGVSSALNYGISNMRGRFFSWLSHDDVYNPEKIAHQVAVATDNKVVMCGRYLIDKNSTIKGDVRERFRINNNCVLDCKKALLALLKQGCFNGCTLLIPRSAFDKCGRFDERLRYCQDLLMWIKVFLGGFDFEFIEEKDVLSRVHTGQLTNTGKDLFHRDCLLLSDVVLSDISAISTKDDNVLYYYAKYNAVYNNPSIVKDCIEKGKALKLFNIVCILKLKVFNTYGVLRPLLKKLYYKVSKK